MLSYKFKPYKYWSIVLTITWITGLLAAYFSYHESLSSLQIPFILAGMLTPFIVSLFMIYGSKSNELKNDFKNRLFNLKSVKPKYWAFILLIVPITVLLATSISLLFGQPLEQFLLAPELAASGAEMVIILIMLILAPTFEELGWRGYGVDSLKQGRTIFKATMIFALLWNIWHWPLFAINGYYQNELLHMSWVYALNFILSVIPAAFLLNWVYYKNNRNIFALIIFHVMFNLFSVPFQTEQFTKCIVTILFTIISIIIFYKDKEFFMMH